MCFPVSQNFQFAQEKQGFKEFLQENKLPCASINEGPEFDKKAAAYLVLIATGINIICGLTMKIGDGVLLYQNPFKIS